MNSPTLALPKFETNLIRYIVHYSNLAGYRGAVGLKTRVPSIWMAPVRAVASFLIEEGCHSAGFVTTIHLRHHLLLSIGWRFSLFAPEEYQKYVIFQFGCQWGKFNSYKTVILSAFEEL